MNLGSDYFVERQVQKKQIRIWKILVIILCCICVILVEMQFKHFNIRNMLTKNEAISYNSQYIASITIEDIIFEDNKREKKLATLENDPNVVAVILYINSPGGSATASERIYNILHKIQAKKPLVVVMGTLAASGGYLISLAADYIISHYTTLTGSIGVIFQNAEVTELAEKLGIKFNNFKSGELKGMLSPSEKVTPLIKEAMDEVIQDMYNYFVDLVVVRRKIPKEKVLKIANGQVYTGRQAYNLKLVDQLGAFEDALTWLHKCGVSKDLEVVEVSLKPTPQFIDMILDKTTSCVKNIILKTSTNSILF